VNQTELGLDYYLCNCVEALSCLSQSWLISEKSVATFEDYENNAQ
jgi:hypothetical protein